MLVDRFNRAHQCFLEPVLNGSAQMSIGIFAERIATDLAQAVALIFQFGALLKHF